MWVDRCWVAEHFAEHLEKLKAIRLEWFMLYHNVGTISSRPYYLPWVAFRDYGDWCDSLGNLLAILTGVADRHRTEHILRYMHQVGNRPALMVYALYDLSFPLAFSKDIVQESRRCGVPTTVRWWRYAPTPRLPCPAPRRTPGHLPPHPLRGPRASHR